MILLPSAVLNTLPRLQFCLCRSSVASPFADPPSQFPELPSHLPLRNPPSHLSLHVHHRICPYAVLPLRIRHHICPWCGSAFAHLPLYLLLHVCQRICLVQTSSHSQSLANLRSTWLQFIARSPLSWSAIQTLLHDFVCNLPLAKGHRTICSWPFGKSSLTNLSLHDRLPTDPRSVFLFPQLPPALWASSFHAEHFPSRSR